MKQQTFHVTYLKLEPYLAIYWRSVMRLRSDEPLLLPQKESEAFFIPYLVRNSGMVRKPARNSRGYLKDTVSYSEAAYDFATSTTQPPLQFDDRKIPTPEECRKLVPFLMPQRIIKRGGVEVETDQFFELSGKGPSRVRDFIRLDFYYELHMRIRYKRPDQTDISIVNEWVNDCNLMFDDPIGFSRTCRYIYKDYGNYSRRGVFRDMDSFTEKLNAWQDEDAELADPDSVRRQMFRYMSERKIFPLFARAYADQQKFKLNDVKTSARKSRTRGLIYDNNGL